MTIKLGVERITSLLARLSDPHLRLPIIHVGGTNGKGSICAFLESILRQAGYRVGRFTSPYLLRPSDSISLNGTEVDPAEFAQTKARIEQISEQERIGASAFEILTAVAFELFAHRPSTHQPLDLAIIEVGLGGTGDATNVCRDSNTLISVISSISLDHQAFLGNTLAEIARVKAGIAKPRVPMVLSDQSKEDSEKAVQQTIQTQAQSTECDLFLTEPTRESRIAVAATTTPSDEVTQIPTRARQSFLHANPTWQWPTDKPHHILLDPQHHPLGSSAYTNIHTAVLVSSLLRSHPHPLSFLPSLRDRLTDQAIRTGLASTRWRGRLERMSMRPLNPSSPRLSVLIDGAHNPAGAAALSEVLSHHRGPITLVFGLSAPREPRPMLNRLLSTRTSQSHMLRLFVTRFKSRGVESGMGWVKAVDPDTIVEALEQELAHVAKFEDVASALEAARAQARPHELTVVCGSLYLVADAIAWLDEFEKCS